MLLRQTNLEKLGERPFDVLVVGCGINGAVVSAALAARGCRVAVIDRGDFAGFTSQESSNLVWGGIKYLENFEFPLVWELCASRNRLMRAYPSNVREVRFYSAVERSFRWPPAALLAGSWLYWAMGRGRTRPPRLLTRARMRSEEPAISPDRFRGGVEYSDAYLIDNDARFVFSFVRSALNVGATVANYASLVSAERRGDFWHVGVRDEIHGTVREVRSRLVVNACGPFVDDVNEMLGVVTPQRHVFSRGVHLVVGRVTDQDRVLTFFDDTGRLFFVIPMGPRSVIGTTDTRVESPVSQVTDEDRQFLLDNVNARLDPTRALGREDIIAERCGVRPLVVADDGTTDDGEWLSLSRRHAVVAGDHVVSIFGGKLTDCLNVGEEVCAEVERWGVRLESAHSNQGWYGEPAPEIAAAFARQARLMRLDDLRANPDHERLSVRLWRRYGLRAFAMLESIRRDPSMDDVLIEGAEYLRCELYHAAQTEMITKLEDFLRRRSKIALVVKHDDLARAHGIREACRILFGEQAEAKYEEYFAGPGGAATPSRSRSGASPSGGG